MHGNSPIFLEPLVGGVSGSEIIEPQHECMWETVGLAGSLGSVDICHFRWDGQIRVWKAYKDV